MADRIYYTPRLQDDRLAREFPGPLHPAGELGGGPKGERLLPKLGVAVVLGAVLAAVGGLTDAGRDQPQIEQLAMPQSAPPAIVIEGEQGDSLAEN